MTAANVHPSDGDLQAYTLGALDDSSYLAVEAHVMACPACQERATIAPGDTFVELLRHARMITPSQLDLTVEWDQAQTSTPLAVGDALTPLAGEGTITGTGDTPGISDAGSAKLSSDGRYRLVRLIGQGGMGVVYQAEHRVMRRAVAVKVIKRAFTGNTAIVERFRREVRAAARLSHPNVVATYDAEDDGESLFIVMEYVEGINLGRLVKEQGRLPVVEACSYIRQAALGLQHAHECGTVHRDVKSDNLIRSVDGTVKILDFGLAALSAERGGGLTDTNVIMGTPDYMAPEQAEDPRNVDARADIYSLGCTLYFLLTGKLPYRTPTSLMTILAHREKPVPAIRKERPEVPAALERVVMRMLAKRPEDRFQTAGEVVSALEPFLHLNLTPPPPKRRLRLAALLAALCIGIVLVAAVYRIQTDKGELVITTESDDVEVVIKKGGKEVQIIDAKTDKQIALALHSGEYEMELRGATEGLKLSVDKAKLTRGHTVLVKIERLPRPAPPMVEVEKTSGASTVPQPRVIAIQCVQRVPLSEHWGYLPSSFVSSDGTFFGADVIENKERLVVVWDGKTGKERYRVPGWMCRLTVDQKKLFVCSAYNGTIYNLHEAATGKRVRQFMFPGRLDGCTLLPDNRHAIMWTLDHNGISHTLHLCDLEEDPILHSWEWNDRYRGPFTDDGRILMHKLPGATNYIVWDVQKNQPSSEMAALAKYSRIIYFLPGNKQAVVQAGHEGQGLIVDVADGKAGLLLERTWPEGVLPCNYALDPRINLVATRSGRICTVDWYTGKVMADFQLPEDEKYAAQTWLHLAPSGQYACVQTDKAIYLLRLVSPPVKAKP